MSRIPTLLGAIAVGVSGAVAVSGIHVRAAQQPTVEACAIPEQQVWRRQAVQLARAINTMEMKTYFKTNAYQPLSALSDITVPDEFSVQLALHESGYIFAIKNAKNPAGCALFSDQAGLIYVAQPLR